MDLKKNHTTVADLLTDDTFLNWFFQAGPGNRDEWIAQNEQNAVLAGCAVRILSVISRVETNGTTTELAIKSFNRLVEKMKADGTIQPPFKTKL